MIADTLGTLEDASATRLLSRLRDERAAVAIGCGDKLAAMKLPRSAIFAMWVPFRDAPSQRLHAKHESVLGVTVGIGD